MQQTDISIPVYNLMACAGGTDFAIQKMTLDEELCALQIPHRNEGYNISLLLQGTIIQYIDFEKHTIQAPAIISMAPEQVHQYVAAKNAEILCVSFSQDFLIAETQGWVACWECMFGHVVMDMDPRHMEELKLYANLMLVEFKSDKSQKDRIIRNLLNAFIICCARIKSQNVTVMQMDSTQNKLVRQFKYHVDSNFREKTMVTEYADLLYVTPGHLNDVIKTIVGKTAKQIIDEKRLMEAKRLLFWGSHSIKEIAWSLKFDDDAYFNRFFKKHTGYTPFLFQRTFREKYN